jgi:hypothetical protein
MFSKGDEGTRVSSVAFHASVASLHTHFLGFPVHDAVCKATYDSGDVIKCLVTDNKKACNFQTSLQLSNHVTVPDNFPHLVTSPDTRLLIVRESKPWRDYINWKTMYPAN